MKNLKNYKLISLFLILAYVLSACSGARAGGGGQAPDDQAQQVVFSGVVEAIGAGQWTVSGQSLSVTGSTSVDANIAVGDNVKVEAVVEQNGTVTALKIEVSGVADDGSGPANSNDDNSNGGNANDNAGNSNDDQNGNANANANTNGDDNSNANSNGNDNGSGTEQEVTGVVTAMTSGSITIDGTEYQIAKFTEFKDLIVVGDQVKVHVIVGADGKLTIREIEKIAGSTLGNDNTNGSDDNSNGNGNSNDDNNSNDDHGGGNGNDNGDDHGGNNNGDDNSGNDNGGSNNNG